MRTSFTCKISWRSLKIPPDYQQFSLIFISWCARFRERCSRIHQTGSNSSSEILIFHLRKPIQSIGKLQMIRGLWCIGSVRGGLWCCIAGFCDPLSIFWRKPLPESIGSFRRWEWALFRKITSDKENAPAKAFKSVQICWEVELRKVFRGSIEAVKVVPLTIHLSDAEPVVLQMTDEGIFQLGINLGWLCNRAIKWDDL